MKIIYLVESYGSSLLLANQEEFETIEQARKNINEKESYQGIVKVTVYNDKSFTRTELEQYMNGIKQK